MTPTTFAVPITGVGRKDYSEAVEFAVEPTISSYQDVFSACQLVTVPALGSVVVDIPVPLAKVVLLYDFMASIPSLNLIRMVVEAVSVLGVGVTAVVDKFGYQTAEVHIIKGCPFFGIIRFTLYNFQAVDENYCRISCSGLYLSETQYNIL